MDKNDMIHTMTIQYFVIYTLSMIATIVFCHLDHPQIKMLPVSYLAQVAVFSFFACLPTMIYYLKNPQSVLVMNVIHTILLEIILLTAGYQIGMYHNLVGGCFFFLTVLVVDILVRLFNYLNDCHTAIEINKSLKNRNGDDYE